MSVTRRSQPGLIRAEIGDITELAVDAFVYYARPDLILGSGFGTAISVRGGAAIQQELGQHGTLGVGEAVVTSGGKLKARHIIHVVGPRFQEQDLEQKLRASIVRALDLAEEHGLERVAFPAMGVGFYGVPLEMSARVSVTTVHTCLQRLARVQEVVFCVRDSREYKPYQSQVAALSPPSPRQQAPAQSAVQQRGPAQSAQGGVR